MYYWSKESSDKIVLEKELLALDNVKELYIGTAFFSCSGMYILKKLIDKYNLKKSQIWIYISEEFTQDKPHELLKELYNIAQAKIISNKNFHAKVYLLKGSVNKVVFGSSNLTNGGFENNIEFDCIKNIENDELIDFKKFFDYCSFMGQEVNQKVIDYYEKNNDLIEELRKSQKELRKKLRGFTRQDDPMDETKYNISDYYFNFTDYETFFPRNEIRNDIEIKNRRKKVQEKILNIHEALYPLIQKLNINSHWNPQHITSVIYPCEYNKGRVNWLGVRYGKTKSEIDVLNMHLDHNDKDEVRGFQKHGCLQYCIVPEGIEINLFLAVKHDAIDRAHIQDNMKKLQPKIEVELQKLKGYGMKWQIYNEYDDEWNTFDIDNQNANEFCGFLRKYDIDGSRSCLVILYDADDERIKTKDNLCKEIIRNFNLIISLYNVMVWRPKI